MRKEWRSTDQGGKKVETENLAAIQVVFADGKLVQALMRDGALVRIMFKEGKLVEMMLRRASGKKEISAEVLPQDVSAFRRTLPQVASA